MPEPIKPDPTATWIAPKTVLAHRAGILALFKKAADVKWSDTAEGAPVVDLIPNPKRYIIATIAGVRAAMDCGEPGMGIRKP